VSSTKTVISIESAARHGILGTAVREGYQSDGAQYSLDVREIHFLGLIRPRMQALQHTNVVDCL